MEYWFFFCKRKTAYEMRISDWGSDVCSSDLLPPETLAKAKAADALLFGAVGDPRFDTVERHLRAEQAILGLRSELGLFANLRPAKLFPGLEDSSALRPEVASAIDMLTVRELTGDV